MEKGLELPELSDETQAIIKAIREASSDNNRQIAATLSKLERLERDVHVIKQAFPEDDAAGHRRYHEAVIKRMEARNALILDVKHHLARTGILGAATFILWLLWRYVMDNKGGV